MTLPNTEKSKAIVMLVGGIVAIVLVITIFSKIFKGFSGAMEGLGLKDSKEGAENKKLIDQAVNAANSGGTGSPWSPNFYKSAPPGSALFTVSQAQLLAKQIWDSVGYVYDTPSRGSAAIKQCKTKSQVSFLAEQFYKLYTKDLISWLNDKYDIMGQREYLRGIIDYVNSLPKYKP